MKQGSQGQDAGAKAGKQAKAFSLLLLIFLGLAVLSGCKPATAEKRHGKFGADSSLPDTFLDPAKPHESQIEQHIDPSAPATHFEDKAIRFADSLLGEGYTSQVPELGDDLPVFECASAKALKKYVRRDVAGRGVVPRHVFQAWEFRDEVQRDSALFAWLGSLRPEGTPVKAGMSGLHLKFPPCMALLESSHVYYIKTACIFEDAGWARMREVLKARAAQNRDNHFFEIRCKGGSLEWDEKQ